MDYKKKIQGTVLGLSALVTALSPSYVSAQSAITPNTLMSVLAQYEDGVLEKPLTMKSDVLYVAEQGFDEQTVLNLEDWGYVHTGYLVKFTPTYFEHTDDFKESGALMAQRAAVAGDWLVGKGIESAVENYNRNAKQSLLNVLDKKYFFEMIDKVILNYARTAHHDDNYRLDTDEKEKIALQLGLDRESLLQYDRTGVIAGSILEVNEEEFKATSRTRFLYDKQVKLADDYDPAKMPD